MNRTPARLTARLALWILASTAVGVHAAEVPLTAQGGALLVEATLNRRFTGRFLVDTGATYCVVGEEVARQAKIRGRVSGEKIRLVTANGGLEAVLGEARKVEVDRAAARDVVVAVTEDPPVHGLAGILGLSFLSRFRYTVDAAGGVLHLDD